MESDWQGEARCPLESRRAAAKSKMTRPALPARLKRRPWRMSAGVMQSTFRKSAATVSILSPAKPSKKKSPGTSQRCRSRNSAESKLSKNGSKGSASSSATTVVSSGSHLRRPPRPPLPPLPRPPRPRPPPLRLIGGLLSSSSSSRVRLACRSCFQPSTRPSQTILRS